MRFAPSILSLGFAVLLCAAAGAQTNTHSLRFHGTGHGQLDRARFQIDDNGPGPDASTGADIGAGPFTIEFWIRGFAAENPSPGRAPGSYADFDWILGNVVFDRDLDSPVERDFGISIRGGQIEFGTGPGSGPGSDPTSNTLVGATQLLDGQWRHIAAVRLADGAKRILVDGVVDAESPPGTSLADLSFPNDGVPGMPQHCSTQSWGNYVVLGAEKHDYDQFEQGCIEGPLPRQDYPSFSGWIDEVRLWHEARSPGEIAADRMVVFAPPLPAALGAYWRFEEGSGTVLHDEVPGNPPGELVGGVPGNGEWSTEVPFSAPASVPGWLGLD